MFINFPLIILAIFSIFFGYITKDIFIGLATDFFSDNSLFIHPLHEIMLDTEFAVPIFFKLLPFILTVSLSLISLTFFEFFSKLLINFKFSNLGYNIFSLLNQRFLIELFYNKYITDIVLKLGGQTTKIIDKGSVELLGPYGLEKGLLNLSKNIGNLSTGVITTYALYILIGLIFYICLLYFSFIVNIMLLSSIFFLLLSNSLSFRRDISIYYSRIGIVIQFYCIFFCYNNLFVSYLDQGIGLFGGLFNISSISIVFDLLIFLLTLFILNLTGFYPRKY